MRAYLPAYEMKSPRSLKDALRLLSGVEGWRPFAGGTDLMVLFEAGRLPQGKYLSIHGLEELRGIRATRETLAIGAATTYSELAVDPVALREFPNLVASSRETGALAIQNRGTLGGNIANASPAADSSPPLLSYGAVLELVSSRGVRSVPYESFHLAYKKTALERGELISRILLPRSVKPGSGRHYFRKVGTRRAQAISKVCLAAWARVEGQRIADVRIAMGSVGPVPIRCTRTESVLRGETRGDRTLLPRAREALASEIAPIDDIRSLAEYRLEVARNLLTEFIDVELGR